MKKKRLMGAASKRRWRLEEEMSFLHPPRRDVADIETAYENIKLELQPHDHDLSNEDLELADCASTSSYGDIRAEAILSERKTPNELEKRELDALELFFSSICATVKQFSRYNQMVAKNKVYTVISELELKHVLEEQAREKGEEPKGEQAVVGCSVDVANVKVETTNVGSPMSSGYGNGSTQDKVMTNFAEESRDCD